MPFVVDRPRWPVAIESPFALLEYLQDTLLPSPLFQAKFGEDFVAPTLEGPRSGGMFLAGGVPFRTIIFGRVKVAPFLDVGQDIFFADCPQEAPQSVIAAFQRQLSTLALAVGEGDDLDCDRSADMLVSNWTDANRATRSGGAHFRVHLAGPGSPRSKIYTPIADDTDLEIEIPLGAEAYPLSKGHWFVAAATLHVLEIRDKKRSGQRNYEVHAHHLRVLPFEDCAVSAVGKDDDATLAHGSQESPYDKVMAELGPPSTWTTLDQLETAEEAISSSAVGKDDDATLSDGSQESPYDKVMAELGPPSTWTTLDQLETAEEAISRTATPLKHRTVTRPHGDICGVSLLLEPGGPRTRYRKCVPNVLQPAPLEEIDRNETVFMIDQTDAAAIRRIKRELYAVEPPYKGFVNVLLIATNATGTAIVPVPLRYGFAPRPDGTLRLQDFDVTWWIDLGSSAAASTIDLLQLSRTINRFPPDDPADLSHGFTVVVSPQVTNLATSADDLHPVNRFINEKVPDLTSQWRGNILVFKHGDGLDPHTIVDMTPHDKALARIIAYRPPRCTPDFYTMSYISPAQLVFNCCAVVQTILIDLSLHDLISVSHLTRAARRTVRACFRFRVVHSLGRVLANGRSPGQSPDAIFKLLFTVMEATGGFLTGSLVLALASLSANDDVPRIGNINILTPYSTFRVWRLLMRTLGFEHRKEAAVGSFLTSTCVVFHMFMRNVGGKLHSVVVIDRQQTLGRPNYHHLDPPWLFTACPFVFKMHRPNARSNDDDTVMLFPWHDTEARELISVAEKIRTRDNVYDAKRTKGALVGHRHPVGLHKGLAETVRKKLPEVASIETFLYYSCYVRTAMSLPPENLDLIAAELDLFDLLHFTHCGSIPNGVGRYVLARHEFWSVMDDGAGGIMGSASVWVTQANPTWFPDNLNLIVIYGKAAAVHGLLLQEGWEGDNVPMRKLNVGQIHNVTHITRAHTRATFKSFTNSEKNLRITVTECADNHIFFPILSSQHTSQTLVLTSTTLIVLHPSDYRRRVAQYRVGSQVSDGVVAQMDASIEKTGFESLMDNIGFDSPCGMGCIGVLRRLRGGRGIGMLVWRSGRADPVGYHASNLFADNRFNLAWCYGVCKNLYCLQSGALVLDDRRYDDLEHAIAKKTADLRLATPAFPAVYSALLFPVESSTATVVPLPLDYGLSEYLFPEDLRTYTWLGFSASGLIYPDMAGFVTKLNNYVWRHPFRNGELLFWLQTVSGDRLINRAVREPSVDSPPLNGDLLVALEVAGKIVDLSSTDVEDIAQAFENVPDEIWVEIFDHLLLPLEDDWLALHKARTKITRLSRRYTTVVEGTTRYWRIIHLHSFTPEEAIKAFARKANGPAITLRIDATDEDEIVAAGGVTEKVKCFPLPRLFELIDSELRRLGPTLVDVEIRVDTVADARELLCILCNFELRIIRQFFCTNRSLRGSPYYVPSSLASLPTLSTVALRCLDPKMLGPGFFAALTSLRISDMWGVFGPTASNVLEVLESTTALVVLELEDVPSSENTEALQVTLPLVTHFSLRYSERRYAHVAASLLLPSLITLRIESTCETVALQTFVDWGGHMLRQAHTIEVSTTRTPPADLEGLLAAAQQMSVMDFRGSDAGISHAISEAIALSNIKMHRLRLLRLTDFIDPIQIRKILGQASAFHSDFILTSGLSSTSSAPENDWTFDGKSLLGRPFTYNEQGLSWIPEAFQRVIAV
ncbi:hypothetical protein C8R43DRAFT_966266 [Mycena crocata]|nr:hypothetical protein C8R43DRAFT_966266 [Mycena crocata]